MRSTSSGGSLLPDQHLGHPHYFRQVREDILPLAEHFIHRHELRLNRHRSPLPRRQRRRSSYPWPGNIRQLESAVERAVHLAEGGALLPEHLGLPDLMENRRPAAPARRRRRLRTSSGRPSPPPRPFWRNISGWPLPSASATHIPEDEQVRSGRINAGETLGEETFHEERGSPPRFPFPKPIGAACLPFPKILYIESLFTAFQAAYSREWNIFPQTSA